MTTATATAYASALVAGACAVLALFLALRTNRRANTLARAAAHARRKARTDAAFVQWAKWTFVSITDVEGALFYRSLHDLRTGPEDLVWIYPRSTLIFQASPEDPDPYHHQEVTPDA